MTTPTITKTRNGKSVGERIELGRYRTTAGVERVVYGQRIDAVVRVTDVPTAAGRAYLIERGLEEDGYDALLALVRDYVEQAQQLGEPPMSKTPLD